MQSRVSLISIVLTVTILGGSACGALLGPPATPTLSATPTPTLEPVPTPTFSGRLLFLDTNELTLLELGEAGNLTPLWKDLPGDIANFREPPGVSSDGRYVVLPGQEQAERIIVDLFSGRVVGRLTLDDTPLDEQFSPLNSHLALATNSSLYVYDMLTGESESVGSAPCGSYFGGAFGQNVTLCGTLNLIGWLDDETLVYSKFVGDLPVTFRPGSHVLEANNTFVLSAAGDRLQVHPVGITGFAGQYGILGKFGPEGSCQYFRPEDFRNNIFPPKTLGVVGDCPSLSPTGRYGFGIAQSIWQLIDLEQELRTSGYSGLGWCRPVWSPDEEHVACGSSSVSILNLTANPGLPERSFDLPDAILLAWIPSEAGLDQSAGAWDMTAPAEDQAPAAGGASPNPATDVIAASSQLTSETLEVTLRLKDLPYELPFDREGVEDCSIEYEWGARVDVDGNAATGDEDGFEYALSAYYISGCESEGIGPEGGPVDPDSQAGQWGRISVDEWEFAADGSRNTRGGPAATSDVMIDPVADTIVLRGDIPGITPASRLQFFAYDYFAGKDVFTP